MKRIYALLILLCLCLTQPILAQESSPYEIALARIAEAQATNATELSLAGLGLTVVPQSIVNLTNLQTLDLSRNRLVNLDLETADGRVIQVIPDDFGNLSQLESLDLSENSLYSLPAAIGELTNLRWLNLRHNDLWYLSPEIGNLTQLEYLNLAANEFNNTGIPPEIGNLSNLTELHLGANQLTEFPLAISNLSNLQKLWLSGNQLTSIPPEIGNLSNLTELSFYNNRLISLPPEIGNLAQLEFLDFQKNNLYRLPPEIGYLTQLERLDLRQNSLEHLPPEIGNLAQLNWLGLSHNSLSTLPSELGNLSNLRTLYLNDNPLLAEYDAPYRQGTDSLLAYLRNPTWWQLQQPIYIGIFSLFLIFLLTFPRWWRGHASPIRQYLQQVSPHRTWQVVLAFSALQLAIITVWLDYFQVKNDLLPLIVVPILGTYWLTQIRVMRSAVHLTQIWRMDIDDTLLQAVHESTRRGKIRAVIVHHWFFIMATALALWVLSLDIGIFLLYGSQSMPRGILETVGVIYTSYIRPTEFYLITPRTGLALLVGLGIVVLTLSNSFLSISIGLWAKQFSRALIVRVALIGLMFSVFSGFYMVRQSPDFECNRTSSGTMRAACTETQLTIIRVVDSLQAMTLSYADGGAAMMSGLLDCGNGNFYMQSYQGRHLLAALATLVSQLMISGVFLWRSRREKAKKLPDSAPSGLRE